MIQHPNLNPSHLAFIWLFRLFEKKLTYFFLLKWIGLHCTIKRFLLFQKSVFSFIYLLFFLWEMLMNAHSLIILFKTNFMWKEKKKTIRLCLVIDFIFYFQKLVFGNIKKKKISLYFWNQKYQKHVWLVEIKKIVFLKKKK